MRLILIVLLFLTHNCFSQTKINLQYRIEKQAKSTPMTSLDDVFFDKMYYSKPLNVEFDGSLLKMSFDNGKVFAEKAVTEVSHNKDTDDGKVIMETIRYVDKANVSDTIEVLIDYEVEEIHIILPTKNEAGKYIGYTSYRQLISEGKLVVE